MELIKKIKQTEAQAQQIIEQAKTEAAGQAEHERQSREQALAQAEQKRKKAIEDAIDAAQEQGLAEIEALKAQAEKDRQHLRDRADSKMAAAVAKVMDYLGSHPRLRGDEFTPARDPALREPKAGAKRPQNENEGPLRG